MFAGKTQIPTSHGQLEAIYRPGRPDAERVGLILHPHPVYGGTMHNPVVFQCAKALEAAGLETLRFNYRGVGESTGSWDDGRGESDDARTALDFLLTSQPAAKQVMVAGYSFGAALGLSLAAQDPRVTHMVAIATPVGLFDPDALRTCPKPKLFIHGSADDLAPLAPLRKAIADTIASPADLRVLDGASHFFDSEQEEMASIVSEWTLSNLTHASSPQ